MSVSEMPAAPPAVVPADPAKGKGVVLFDGNCELCRRGVRSLKRLDWRHKLHFQDLNDTAHWPACAQPLDLTRLLEQMHVVTPDRRRAYAGYAAFRWIAWRIPVLMPFAPLMYVPGVPWLGNKIYKWVARNRYNLVPCGDGGCRIHLKKK